MKPSANRAGPPRIPTLSHSRSQPNLRRPQDRLESSSPPPLPNTKVSQLSLRSTPYSTPRPKAQTRPPSRANESSKRDVSRPISPLTKASASSSSIPSSSTTFRSGVAARALKSDPTGRGVKSEEQGEEEVSSENRRPGASGATRGQERDEDADTSATSIHSDDETAGVDRVIVCVR